MPLHEIKEKNCAECNHPLTFEDFCRINPSMLLKRAQEFWQDSLFLIYCPECYFSLPERPFKVKRGYFNYRSRY